MTLDWMQVAEVALQAVLVIVLPLIANLLRKWLADKLDDKQRAIAVGIAESAFFVVEKIAKQTPGTIDDKLAAGLQQVADMLGREPTPVEIQVAKSTFAKMGAAGSLLMENRETIKP